MGSVRYRSPNTAFRWITGSRPLAHGDGDADGVRSKGVDGSDKRGREAESLFDIVAIE